MLSTVADTLHKISLPAELSINECNAKIEVVDKSLSLRSRLLLKRPRCAKTQKGPTEEQPIQYTSRPDPAVYCPMLYTKFDDSNEDQLPEAAESTGPREIKTSDIGDSGDDLTHGILTIDGSRYLLSIVRKEVKAI